MEKQIAMPRISVIVPVYNSSNYISKTLQSICNQTVKEIEIVVVDDCSTDNTFELVNELARWDKRILCIRTVENTGGPAGPRNLGIRRSRAELVAFCDADDLWIEDKLERQLDLMDSINADLLCANVSPFEDDSVVILNCIGRKAKPNIKSLKLTTMFWKNTIATSSVLCRRYLLKINKGFNEDKLFVAVEDYDLWLRILEDPKVKAYYASERLVFYRVLLNSLSRNKLKQPVRVSRVILAYFKRSNKQIYFYILIPFFLASFVVISFLSRKKI